MREPNALYRAKLLLEIAKISIKPANLHRVVTGDNIPIIPNGFIERISLARDAVSYPSRILCCCKLNLRRVLTPAKVGSRGDVSTAGAGS